MLGLGTLINVVAILVGSTVGTLVGNRLPERTRDAVTDALGLTTLVVGALNITALSDPAFRSAVGGGRTLLVVLGALVVGAIAGSILRIESRLETAGGWLQSRLTRGSAGEGRARFIEGFVAASLLFCIGPLAVLGSLSDGLGNGIDQLVLKSTLDLFAAVAFASTLGWGVAAAAISVGLYQGALTLLGATVGTVLPDALIASITATGGVLLLGIGLRLLQVRAVPVGDMLPSLVAAPVITALVVVAAR
jgi:uncharacterized protein